VAVSRRLLPDMILLCMREREPLHEKGHIAIAARIEKQMPVIGHESVGQEAHIEPLHGIFEQHLEMPVLIWFVKDRPPTIRTVHDVIHEILDIDTRRATHDESVSRINGT